MHKSRIHNEIAVLTGKKIRKIRGKTNPVDFSRITGIHKDQVNRYEKGRSLPRDDTLIKIAQYGNVPLDYFKIGDQPPIYEIQTTEQRNLLDKVKKILESDNEYATNALKANIEAFFQMVCTSKGTDENKGGD